MPRCLLLALIALVPLACSKSGGDATPVAEATEVKKVDAASSTPNEQYAQAFAQAVTMELGEDQQIPPDRTIAGKPTGPLREAVEKLWPSISLTDSSGKLTHFVVTLETAEGSIDMTLRPDLAPNHVRNFLALVKLGYYDGLQFDRVVHQEGMLPDNQKVTIELLKAGCPAGTGDAGIGHIGYHLKPEFSETKHEEGTVGMMHDTDPNTAGVRFYIALGPSPVLDGNFTIIGKVSNGMDVAKRISLGKLLPPEQDPSRELPQQPVVIKKATATPEAVASK
jgi:cyclophilin family peptidyl-prolyl cis-trans isomerase